MARNYGKMGKIDEERVGRSVLTLSWRNLPHLSRVEDLAEMAAMGLGLPRSTFKEAGKYG
jgi:hypothetical protein